MLGHRNINYICWAAALCGVLLVVLFGAGALAGWISGGTSLGYENRLFDTSRVHRIDIVMDGWEEFLDTAVSEEYSPCTVVIDGESYKNVGIRGKGNTSLTQVASYGNDRYSFKVEFDKYSVGGNYYGLDKLCLNNLISDNTYLKDYLCYRMMGTAGVAAPLCSFVWITVNGEDWGLYLAVEGVEDAFLQRNYGSGHGNLYKPDSMDFGGGRGNGAGFRMEEFERKFGEEESGERPEGEELPAPGEMGERPESGELPAPGEMGERPEGEGMRPPGESADFGGGRGGDRGMGSSDVKLQYTDDDPASYPNIFDNAKTGITRADKRRLIASLKQLGQGEEIEEAVDVEAVIRYLVVHNFVCNSDSYTGMMVHNYYLYEEDGVLAMLPWDYNLAFGGMGAGGGKRNGEKADGTGGTMAEQNTATAEVNQPIDSPVTEGTLESRPMVSWIFGSEEYTALYHQYYAEFIETYFNSGYFEEMLEETIALISPYVEQDPTAFCTYEEFQTGTKALREFCLLRAESVSGQLAGTIPSTQEGQQGAEDSLVDASHVSVSDMGAFFGGGPGGEGGPGERPNGEPDGNFRGGPGGGRFKEDAGRMFRGAAPGIFRGGTGNAF